MYSGVTRSIDVHLLFGLYSESLNLIDPYCNPLGATRFKVYGPSSRFGIGGLKRESDRHKI